MELRRRRADAMAGRWQSVVVPPRPKRGEAPPAVRPRRWRWEPPPGTGPRLVSPAGHLSREAVSADASYWRPAGA